MRRILAFDWLTADGSFAGADGNLNWVVPDDEQAKAAAMGTPAADTVLFGCRTYEIFEDSGGKPCKTPPRRILTVQATVARAPSDRRLDERGDQARFLPNTERSDVEQRSPRS